MVPQNVYRRRVSLTYQDMDKPAARRVDMVFIGLSAALLALLVWLVVYSAFIIRNNSVDASAN
jgi:hypothetical protein